MNRRRLDPSQRQERADRRLTARENARAKIDNLRDWHTARHEAAVKRRQARHEESKLKQAVDDLTRGVNRVPAHLRGLTVTDRPYLVSRTRPGGRGGRKLAQPEDLHPAGNYETRRARGQRGHQRPPRRRDLPGAVARRLERNRKAWLDA